MRSQRPQAEIILPLDRDWISDSLCVECVVKNAPDIQPARWVRLTLKERSQLPHLKTLMFLCDRHMRTSEAFSQIHIAMPIEGSLSGD